MTTLYRYFDVDGELLYIGVTDHPLRRADAHHCESLWWSHVASAKFEHIPGRTAAIAAEALAIAEEAPIFNVNGAPPESFAKRARYDAALDERAVQAYRRMVHADG